MGGKNGEPEETQGSENSIKRGEVSETPVIEKLSRVADSSAPSSGS